MSQSLPPPTLVQDASGFRRMLEDLSAQREIAVDTEADSFYSYREKVCLIQVTVEDRDYLVDPLAGFDIGGLGRVLADPERTKVFHDGEYDILLFKRRYGFGFANLFDTRVAAAALGSPNPGLANVLRERYGIELDKSMQRSNWAQRPLTDKQVRYARLDTRFLLSLMREQRRELESRGRLHFVEGECWRLERIDPPDDSFDADEFVRLKGARTLAPESRQALRELYIWRDAAASAADDPPFRVLLNEQLLEIAARRPKDHTELGRVPNVSPRVLARHGEGILAALRRSRELGPLRQWPQLPNREGTNGMDEAQLELHERLKNCRKDLAARIGIDSAYLINRHVLVRIARQLPRSPAELEAIEGLLPWQARDYGPALLEVVRRFEAELASGSLPIKRRPFRR